MIQVTNTTNDQPQLEAPSIEELSITIPQHLIEEIAYNRCIIFLGSGVSSTSKNTQGQRPIGWESFIEEAKNLIPHTYNDKKDYVDECMERKEYLHSLQVIKDYSESSSYSTLLRNSFGDYSFRPSLAHEIIRKLNLKVVVSTNFDRIYDNYCISSASDNSGHVVKNYYDIDDIIFNLKSHDNLIIKAHGTIDSMDKLIFTQDEYYKARREHPMFYKVLESLFLTHTVLFLGYSLNDPDINLLLDTAANTKSSSSPHFVFVKDDVHPELQKHWKTNYNISTIPYGSDHDHFIPSIELLYEKVMQLRMERGLDSWVIE